MPKRSNKINNGTTGTISERLMKLSHSKSYMFLGRRSSETNNSKHGNNNNNNNIHTTRKSYKSDITIHTRKTSLYRDDFLFFEIYQ
ncbi:MAG: hypothetical protein ACI8RD_004036, partial [Bacillariaceae sp.]